MDLKQYRADFVEQLRVNAQAYGVTPEEAFVNESVEKLEALGELVDPFIKYFGQRGPKNVQMKIDGFSIDPSDKTLILFQSDFRNSEEQERIILSDLDQKFRQMTTFLKVCVSGTLRNYCDDSNEYVKIADDIKDRFAINLINSDQEDASIEKIRLIIITNAQLSTGIKNLPDDELEGRKVERTIWSLERFYEIDAQGREREPVLIDVEEFGYMGIPCLHADMSEGLDYEAYLSIIPGKLLSDIYYKHGSKILEGNVRAFLSNKGKINQGIRKTILSEPTKFFTYNNGIACTAEELGTKMVDGVLYITSIKDLQIINGGQTTASLTSAVLKDKNKLENIYVPMKLTVIKNKEEYGDMVQKISRYANSQNKVTDADFFSNHPFHVQFEQLSKKVVAPATNGSVTQTMWYYERSRGKYNQEMFKMSEAQRDSFKNKYPKNQVIKKEELAKYYNVLEMKPYIVALGAAKNMNNFAKTIEDVWEKRKQEINEYFFKRCICATIIFRETDKIVFNSPWYETGGFKSQVVPYTIAKILDSIPKNKDLDWEKIWKYQTMYSGLKREIEKVAEITNTFIQNSHGALVSEYAKRPATWEAFRNYKIELSSSFVMSLIDKDEAKHEASLAAKDQKQSNDLNIEAEIMRLGSDYWKKIMNEAIQRGIVGPMDVKYLQMLSSGTMVPSPSQAKYIWKMRERFGNSGIII